MTAATLSKVQTISVLLVEDSLDHQEGTRRVLEHAGIQVAIAATGEEALVTLAAGAPFDLVLIDQGLPAMCGMDLLEYVIDMHDGPGAIMVTASIEAGLIREAMREGAIDFVTKEVGYLELLPAVVRRAYAQFDQLRRTKELQRLALLVHRSSELEVTVREVTVGACRLLHATGALLLVEKPSTPGCWRSVAREGAVEDLPEEAARRLIESSGELLHGEGMLAVRLPAEADEQDGFLLVARDRALPWTPAEMELARTFAAYVASALRHGRRAELEGGLIEELQHAMRVRRDFVASVSHELRTPLTSIRGYAETIEHLGKEMPHEQLLDIVGRIRRNAGELERMVDQLIDLARLERGAGLATDLERTLLAEAVHKTLADVAPMLDKITLEVDLPGDVAVLVDLELLHRVVVNLLTNAAKYSPEGGLVQMAAFVVGDVVRVHVRDHGIGVAAADSQLIFQPFWRAPHAVAQAVRGTGIGLGLVHGYLAAMGGKVGVEQPEDGPGSVFWFTLPLADA